MKIRSNIILMSIALLTILQFSCNKETELTPPNNNHQETPTFYYLDGVAISEAKFLANYQDYRNVSELTTDSGTNQQVLIQHSFTNLEKYVQWGEDNGHDLASGLKKEQEIRAFAEANGVIEHYEQTGELTLEFQDFLATYEKENSSEGAAQERTITHLSDFCSYQPYIVMATIMPVMPGGWNNRVSRAASTGVFSLLTVYNRSFFRNPITTVVLGLSYHQCWEGPGTVNMLLNNRMSSAIAT